MQDDRTDITIVLDRSGSMQGGAYGLAVANTTNYAANSDSVATLSTGLSASVGNLRGGGSWNRVPDAV